MVQTSCGQGFQGIWITWFILWYLFVQTVRHTAPQIQRLPCFSALPGIVFTTKISKCSKKLRQGLLVCFIVANQTGKSHNNVGAKCETFNKLTALQMINEQPCKNRPSMSGKILFYTIKINGEAEALVHETEQTHHQNQHLSLGKTQINTTISNL